MNFISRTSWFSVCRTRTVRFNAGETSSIPASPDGLRPPLCVLEELSRFTAQKILDWVSVTRPSVTGSVNGPGGPHKRDFLHPLTEPSPLVWLLASHGKSNFLHSPNLFNRWLKMSHSDSLMCKKWVISGQHLENQEKVDTEKKGWNSKKSRFYD